MDHAGRLAWMAAQGRREQREIWQAAQASIPVDFEQFVPARVGPLTPVRHAGRNTLPLPPPHRGFEKRFCRGRDGVVFGYNEAPSRPWIGPGYFVVRESDRGLLIDYGRLPEGEVPEGWPPVVPCSRGLQRFVYHRTQDFMRRVATHVSIGSAWRGARPLDHYFLLCREP